MKVYIKEHKRHAGKWIYEGYKSAWTHLGYDTEYYSDLHDIKGDDYQLMALDGDVNFSNISKLEKANRVYLHTQPNHFPLPWGSHPNFVSTCPLNVIDVISKMDNVYKWSFGMVTDFHKKWGHVHEIPLAFDSINYRPVKDKRYEFDVCFIGGWADNGFNEKMKIIIEHLGPFKASGLKCGFFINKNISHNDENLILSNSKIAINIHDAYQRKLGLDTNERTFKSLGLNGFLISDHVEYIKNTLPNALLAKTAKDMFDLIMEYIEKDLQATKNKNREDILKNHTYKTRVQEFLSL